MPSKRVEDPLGDDRWFTAEQALALKLIDGITELPQEETPEGLTSDSSTQDIYQAFTNRLQMQASSTNIPMNLYEQIKQLPTFQNVSEGAVVDHIRALESKVVKLESTEQALAQAQAELQTLKDRELEGIVNSAVAECEPHGHSAYTLIGRGSQKPIYLNLLKTNREEAEKLLNSLAKPKTPIRRATDYTQPQASGGASTKFAGKSWDELNGAKPKGLDPDSLHFLADLLKARIISTLLGEEEEDGEEEDGTEDEEEDCPQPYPLMRVKVSVDISTENLETES